MSATTLPPATSMEHQLGTVADAMTGEVLSFDVDTTADLAMRRLERTRVSGAPVLDHGRVVGLVTLRDLLPGPRRTALRPARAARSCDTSTCSPGTPCGS
jgi:CBS-domain-containing membrane protein